MSSFSQLTTGVDFKIKRLQAQINKSAYFGFELVRSIVSPTPGIKILFSLKSGREKTISRGFNFLKHQVDFNAFTPENIKKNDLIVPLTIWDLRAMEEVRHLLVNNPIPIPSLEAINVCDDKFLFGKALCELGFGEVIPKIGHGLKYPFILKKRIAFSGDNCYIISNPEQEKEHGDIIYDPDYFCQELVQGKNEYATHILFKDNKIVTSLNIEYVFSSDAFVKGKDKFICTRVTHTHHLELFSSILAAIGYEGVCCFNYKEIDGRPYILEINPRFGSSLSSFFFSFIRRLDLSKTARCE